MQTFADILGLPIHVARTTQGPALGSAIFAAVAAGSSAGGYETIDQASAAMQSPVIRSYQPDPERHAIYNRLYEQFKTLHDYFGRGENNVMEFLKDLRAEAAPK